MAVLFPKSRKLERHGVLAASQEFKEKVSTKQHHHVLMISAKWTSHVNTPPHHLMEVHLTEDAQDCLINEGPNEFFRIYGTHYVGGLQKGLTYSVILTYTSDDKEAVRKVVANFDSKVGLCPLN